MNNFSSHAVSLGYIHGFCVLWEELDTTRVQVWLPLTLTYSTFSTDKNFITGYQRHVRAHWTFGVFPRDPSWKRERALELQYKAEKMKPYSHADISCRVSVLRCIPCCISFQSTQNLELSSNVTKQLCFEVLIYRKDTANELCMIKRESQRCFFKSRQFVFALCRRHCFL